MEIIKLAATRRAQSGKGPSFRLRKEGQIPAVAYGKDLPATPLALAPKGLLQVLRSDHGQNSVVELAIDGGESLMVMVRDYTYHPITRQLLHADFVQVKLDEPVETKIPLRLVGKAKGLALGGTLQQIFRDIPIRCLPELVPSLVEVDISDLDVGDTMKAGMLKLPEGVSVLLPEDKTIAVINAPDKAAIEEDKAAAAAAAAPAAGAAAAKAPEKKKDKK